CSGPEHDGPSAQPAHGTLTVNGDPAVGANVTLHPADGQNFDTRGSRPTGRVLDDGSFLLSTYETNDGAPVGDYVVTVFWAKNPDAIEPSPDRLQNRYVNPKTSKIRVRIDEGENTLPPIELNTTKG
ncbi:MAG: carboxypeptidase regulatory-like domain-containing protein, partial [Planctomycetaceae bacterium]|nr:carboxypeptidase regulatory-like domain-containing protein [Planctomycetaceae bacterium]